MPILKIETDDQLKKILRETNGPPIVVKWGATWCKPCKQIMPHYEMLSNAAEYKDYITFLEIDINECEEMADAFDTKEIPAFHFIYGGKMSQIVGANPDMLSKFIEYHFSNAVEESE